ncbi:MAG: response regulator transcription factor [Alphaproteobacteria bacterium]|nr:response regulator transcription factor [Alphaproteobacteria bacterium]MBF0375156.1 response regulator transcription factor [Alphaproteobacteria bacterium]MBF0392760.1 response regulator transcription factor [Alphaproteobacteria bacterium]
MSTQRKVLVIEDEPDLRATTVSFLNLSGFVADGVGGCAECEAWLTTHDCDLVVLDLGLPDGAGLPIAQTLKARGKYGIVIVTARGELDDRLRGYEFGADQYLVKPVDMRELVAVLNALYDRLPVAKPSWRLDPLTWRLTASNGREVRLTQSELIVLKTMTQVPGELVSRTAVIESLGYQAAGYDPRRLEILIRRLRNKIAEETGLDVPIETVHGLGYAFTASINVS